MHSTVVEGVGSEPDSWVQILAIYLIKNTHSWALPQAN